MKKVLITSQELREKGISLPFQIITNEGGEPMAFELTSVSPKNGDSNTLLFAIKGIEGAIAITDLNKGRLIKKITGKNESAITPTEKRLLFPVLRKLLAKGQNTVTVAKRAKYEDDTHVEAVEVNGVRTEWRGDTVYLVDNLLAEDAYDLFEAEILKAHNAASIAVEAKELAMQNAAKSTNKRVINDDSVTIVEEPALVAAAVVAEVPAEEPVAEATQATA